MKFKLNIPAALLIFLILYVLLLGVRPLVSPDEARYVEIPREMLADHDYVTPRLNGARYFEKPIMGYWLIAGAMRVFGENAFAGRFAPAVSTGLAALIVLLLAQKMTGRREVGWFAAGTFLLMPLVFIVGTTCTLDAIFSLFVTATVAAFYCAMEGFLEKKPVKCVLWLLATGAAAGCAFLVKGFLAFALPGGMDTAWMDGFMRGYGDVSARFGAPLLGGDTTSSPDRLCICVTVTGECPAGSEVRRSGASAGDLLCVTGPLGDSAAGLRIIKEGLPREGAAAVLVGRHYRPLPRVQEGAELRQAGVSAMMDISDGIASDLRHILEASGVGARIRVAGIPLSEEFRQVCAAQGWDPVRLAVCGGEDYELLFTVRPELEPALKVPHTVIGEVVPGEGIVWEGAEGEDFEGFRHF